MEDYIAHRRSGLHYETRKSHKYFKRIETGNRKKPYIYFYSAAEYRAYLKTGKVPKGNGNVGASTRSSVSRSSSRKQSVFKKLGNILNRALRDFKHTVDKDGNGRWDLIDKVSPKKKETPKPQQQTRPQTKPQQNNSQEPGHDKEPANHKYVAKIRVNGKYRYFYSKAELEAYYNKDPEKRQEREIMSKFNLIDEPQTEYDSQSQINKNYRKSMYGDVDLEPGWSNNCYDCTLAWEARKRGYDAEAQYDPNGGSPDTISNFYEGVKNPFTEQGGQLYFNKNSGWDWSAEDGKSASTGKETMENTADMLNEKYEDGARGNLNLYWQGGGGHSVAWEKKDGEIYIHDAQNNTVQKMKNYSEADYVIPNMAFTLRTDDKKLTKQAADYLEPADDVDEARNNRNVTYNYDVKTIQDMVDRDDGTQIVPRNEEERTRFINFQKKMSEVADDATWSHERVKREVYGE